jgi:hypothetical protein
MTTRPDRLAETLRAALEGEAPAAGVVEDDDALLARAIDGAMASTVVAAPEAPEVRAPASKTSGADSVYSLPARGRRTPVRLVRYVLPVAAAFIASLAMAAVYMTYRAPPPWPDEPRTDLPAPKPILTSPARVEPVPVPASDGAPTISIDDLPTVTPRRSASAPVAPRDITPSPVESPATAAELFRDANATRRAGDVGKSVEIYKTLIARHGDTPEAHAARVSLGRLLLDKQGDTAGALAQFDSYLKSSSSDRALAEEARLGRALVFLRQGLQVEERRAWQELLERHPDSLHGSRARERLRALTPEPSSPAP